MFELAHRLVGIYKTSNVSLGPRYDRNYADVLVRQCTKVCYVQEGSEIALTSVSQSIAIDNKDLRTQALPRPRKPLGSPDKSQQIPASQLSPSKQRPRPFQAVIA